MRVLEQKSIGARIQGEKVKNSEAVRRGVRWTQQVRRMSYFYTARLHIFVHARTLCAPAQGPAHELGFFKFRRKSAPQVSLT